MPRIAEDPVRENRILEEIIVDAHGSDERALGWYYHLENSLPFPFRARCVQRHRTSPLEPGEDVRVVGMPPEHACMVEMLVTVRWEQRRFAVPLAQLEPVGETSLSDAAREAVDDWLYWVRRGYSF